MTMINLYSRFGGTGITQIVMKLIKIDELWQSIVDKRLNRFQWVLAMWRWIEFSLYKITTKTFSRMNALFFSAHLRYVQFFLTIWFYRAVKSRYVLKKVWLFTFAVEVCQLLCTLMLWSPSWFWQLPRSGFCCTICVRIIFQHTILQYLPLCLHWCQ